MNLSVAHGYEIGWKSALVLACAGLVALRLHRAPAALRHLAWSLGAMGSLLVPLLVLSLPSWDLAVVPFGPERTHAPSAAHSSSPGLNRPATPVTWLQFDASKTMLDRMYELTAGVESAHREAASVAPPPSPVGRSLNVVATGFSVWLIVFSLVVTIPLVGRLSLIRLSRGAIPVDPEDWHHLQQILGIRRRVTVLRSGGVPMPMTWGCLRPVILLPDGAELWSAGRRRNVLLHELAHVRRLDCLTQEFANLACAIHWFNPLVWVAAWRMRVERERACDDMVLSTGARPSEYAGLLLEMARGMRPCRTAPLAAVAMARPSGLEGRLRAILDPFARRGRIRKRDVLVASLGLATLALPLSAVRLKAKQLEPEKGAAPVAEFKAPDSKPTTIVSGRVIDPDGTPVPGAIVDVVGRPKRVWVGASIDEESCRQLAQGQTDSDGRYRIEAPRTSSTGYYSVHAMSVAPGYGLGWAELNPDAERPSAEIRLHKGQQIRVKLVDLTGMPAQNVTVRVHGMYREKGKPEPEGVYLGEDLPKTLRSWPNPGATDSQGRITLEGIPADFQVSLSIRDSRFARQTPTLKTNGLAVTIALEPARIIEGRVIAEDTGKPMPYAVISAGARIQNEQANGSFWTKFKADADGNFRINPLSGDEYTLHAFAPPGEPYLTSNDKLIWTKGAVKMTRVFKLRRGVLLQGKVTEAEGGRSLAGASVQYMPIRGADSILSGWQGIVPTGQDGNYQIAVQPGKGHLLIFGPTSDYVLEHISERMIYNGKPGGRRYYAHKVIPYELRAGTDRVELDAVLRRGKTIRGKVSGPGGETVTDALVLTSLDISPHNPHWRGNSQIQVRDGHFEVHGVPPEGIARFDILDPVNHWGASLEVPGRKADEELSVTLQPCGRARARLIGPDGKPARSLFPYLDYIATPGPHPFSRESKELAADSEWVVNVDRRNYENIFTDVQGHVTLPALIPGALYRLTDFSTVNDAAKGVQIRREFRVKPGETLELGDILIEKPAD